MVPYLLRLVSTENRRPSVDLNITVRDLRHIPGYCVILKNSLKNSVDEDIGEYSASEGAFERLVSIQPQVKVDCGGIASRKYSVLGFHGTRCGVGAMGVVVCSVPTVISRTRR